MADRALLETAPPLHMQQPATGTITPALPVQDGDFYKAEAVDDDDIYEAEAVDDDDDDDKTIMGDYNVDECAIYDDDDLSGYEYSVQDGGRDSSKDNKLAFQRVDCEVNLSTRTSLLTLLLSSQPAATLVGNPSPHRPQPSPSDSDNASLTTPRTSSHNPPSLQSITEVPRSARPAHRNDDCHHGPHRPSQHALGRADRVVALPPPVGTIADDVDGRRLPQTLQYVGCGQPAPVPRTALHVARQGRQIKQLEPLL